MKTRAELLEEDYLCKKDIQILFRMSRTKAEQAFWAAHQRDEEQLGRSRMYYYGKKVSLKSALWAAGTDLNFMQKQIKGGATPAK